MDDSALTKVNEDSMIRQRGLRRVASMTKTDSVKAVEKKYRASRVDQPIHLHQDSLFSSSSGFTDFRGFFNLAILLLLLSSARVALENIIKYGLLVDPLYFLQKLVSNPLELPNFVIVVGNGAFMLVAFITERLLAFSKIPEGLGTFVLYSNLFLQLFIPAYVILTLHPNPLYSSLALGLTTIVFLKLISYSQTLQWCRAARDEAASTNNKRGRPRYKSISSTKNLLNDGNSSEAVVKRKKNGLNGITELHEGQSGDANGVIKVSTLATNVYHTDKVVFYPDNLTIKDLMYFIVSPTLCYELSFPKSERIRKRFLLKRVTEVICISGLIFALIQQWVLPLVNNALTPFSAMHLPNMVERILKLALPNFCIWLLWFYVTFHSFFNVLSEVLYFGDRIFYQDWWNAESVTEFWKKWNVPVHRWAVRHLYKPLLKRGYTKFHCALAVFVASAFFHELLVSVPLGMFRVYAFGGMLLQVPLAVFTDKMYRRSPILCNVIVWMSLIIGQPIAVLMYYVDYYVVNVSMNVTANITGAV